MQIKLLEIKDCVRPGCLLVGKDASYTALYQYIYSDEMAEVAIVPLAMGALRSYRFVRVAFTHWRTLTIIPIS